MNALVIIIIYTEEVCLTVFHDFQICSRGLCHDAELLFSTHTYVRRYVRTRARARTHTHTHKNIGFMRGHDDKVSCVSFLSFLCLRIDTQDL